MNHHPALIACDDLFRRHLAALDGAWRPLAGLPTRPATLDEVELRGLCLQALSDHDLAELGDDIASTDLRSVVRVVHRGLVRARNAGEHGQRAGVAEHLGWGEGLAP